jgi:hypothetical protein
MSKLLGRSTSFWQARVFVCQGCLFYLQFDLFKSIDTVAVTASTRWNSLVSLMTVLAGAHEHLVNAAILELVDRRRSGWSLVRLIAVELQAEGLAEACSLSN